jgi:hypothetical protein
MPELIQTVPMAVTQRRFPYPYKALLAISADVDSTYPWQFTRIHKFLNTLTPAISDYGDGVGLDIGNSFFFKNISNKGLSVYDACYRYKNEDAWADEFAGDQARVMDPQNARDPVTGRLIFENGPRFIEKYIRCGWIDVLHGGDGNWGEVALTRGATDWCRIDGEHYAIWVAERGLKIDTFSNHSEVTSDFGVPSQPSTAEKPRSLGDLPSSSAYWADYARRSGIKFYWSYIPTESAAYRRTIGQDTMLVPATFRDGAKFWHFSRYTSGKPYADTVDSILNRSNLDSLVSGNKFEIAYTHFGYRSRPANHRWLASLKRMIDLPGRIHRRISPAARNRWLARVNAVDTHTKLSASSTRSFRQLKVYQDEGKILVAKTSRLLRYNLALDHLAFTEAQVNGRTIVDITAIKDTQFGDFRPTMKDLRGVTFYVADSSKAEIRLCSTSVPEREIQRNPADEAGKQSISIKWFQPDYTDYTILSLTDVKRSFFQ